MNYLIIIIAFGLGAWFGMYLSKKRGSGGFVALQSKKKLENKSKILDFLKENEKVTNNDVEKLTGVSNATAERYLDELEKEGKLQQLGKIGPSVFYTKK